MSNDQDPSNVRPPGSGPRARPGSDPVPKTRYREGEVIAGKYTLGRQLGQGGMGEVWLAHNQTLDINVAIKLIRTGDEATTDRADRLLNEARAAAKLGHPAIVRVNDFGKTDQGDPYIVMELLEGEDLAVALSRRGHLSPVRATRTLLPIANALAVAHTKGIVHRDLKPENIFLAQNEDGQIQPKLVDFGVAKLEVGHTGRLTQTGELMGSPLYMSPEQARGDDVDHRADIWGLGVVLYEILTGHPPFEGKNYNAVLYSIIANPPTPITDKGIAEPELSALILKALEKDPANRWFSMRDFGEALAHWLEQRGVSEDIAGASLQTAWFSWVKSEDQLESGRPEAAMDGEGIPTPDIPPPPLLPRGREITIKTSRKRARSLTLLLAGAAVALAVGVALWVGLQGETPVVGTPEHDRAGTSPSPAGHPVAEPASGVTVLDEAAGEMTGVFINQPALDPSALPQAHDEQLRRSPAAAAPAPPRSAPRPTAAPKRATKGSDGHVSASGIVVKDPYASDSNR
jgi:eukaryotic-like serine/threonine-protein kinase